VSDRRTDNADHYYSWPPHCGRPANKTVECWLCAAYQVVKNSVSGADTHPQLTVRGIGYVNSLFVLCTCEHVIKESVVAL